MWQLIAHITVTEWSVLTGALLTAIFVTWWV